MKPHTNGSDGQLAQIQSEFAKDLAGLDEVENVEAKINKRYFSCHDTEQILHYQTERKLWWLHYICTRLGHRFRTGISCSFFKELLFVSLLKHNSGPLKYSRLFQKLFFSINFSGFELGKKLQRARELINFSLRQRILNAKMALLNVECMLDLDSPMPYDADDVVFDYSLVENTDYSISVDVHSEGKR